MRESRPSGSVGGPGGNARAYPTAYQTALVVGQPVGIRARDYSRRTFEGRTAFIRQCWRRAPIRSLPSTTASLPGSGPQYRWKGYDPRAGQAAADVGCFAGGTDCLASNA